MKYSPRHSMVSHILFVFILFNAISLFVFSYYVIEKDKRIAERYAEGSLREIAVEKASLIDLTLSGIAYETENIAKWAEEYIARESEDRLSDQYISNEEGALYRKPAGQEDYGPISNVFFPRDIEITAERRKIINATEKLDREFIRFIETHNAIQWVYIATEDGLLRCYPYPEMDVYTPTHQQKGDPFYVAADQAHNPQRRTIWTTPYADYLWTGWLISCSHPVYIGDTFIGVVSSDVRLETLQQQYLADLRLGDSARVYLLNSEGDIIYHPDHIIEIERQGQVYLNNVFDSETMEDNQVEAIKNILWSSGDGIVSYLAGQEQEGGERVKTIAFAKIEEQGWTIAVEIDRDEYLANYDFNKENLFLFLAITIATLLILAFLLYYRFSKPIARLVKQAEEIAEGNFEEREIPDGYKEIHTLARTFNFMSRKIQVYTEDLIRKNSEVKTVFNSIGGLLMILDPAGEIIMCNERGKKRTCGKGKCFEILAGRSSVCPDCKLQYVLETGTAAYGRVACGGEIYSNSYYPISGKDGSLTEVVVYSLRVTEKVLMERELQQADKLAGIGQISNAIAHELKNPLAVIKGSAYLLRAYLESDSTPVQDQREAVETIWESVKESEQVIHSLLDFSGRSEEEFELVDVSKIINQILLLNHYDCVKNHIQIELFFDPDPLLYYGKKEALKSIVQNIVTNAIHALPEGGTVHIKGKIKQTGSGKKAMTISVADDGPGIAQEILEKIYQPFFTTRKKGGNGLGLWITKMLVEKMNGTIDVRSKVGEGTVFSLTFPQNEDAA